MESLQKKAVSGVKWTALKTGLVAGTGPVLQIIKARFLIPEEFAYIAIIMIFIGLSKNLENFGISQAIIQRDYVDKKEASSLFFFNLFLAIALGLALYFSSNYIESFFSLPNLNLYLKFTSLIVVFGGPLAFFRAFLQKHFLFKELSIVEMTRNIFMLIIITVMLLMGFGVLGIVYTNIIVTFFSAIAIACLCIKNKIVQICPYFSLKMLLPFLTFGLYVSSKQVITFISNRLDEILVGFFFTPEILGIYYFGKNMILKLKDLLTASFSKVLLPVFSKLKNDNKKISFAYRKITLYVSFIAFPFFTGIAVTAHLFVPIIFGEKWIDSVLVFQVFSLAAMFKVLTANLSSSLLYSINKPETVFYIEVLTSIIYIISLYIFAPGGIIAVLVVYSIYSVLKTFLLQLYVNKQLAHTFSDYLNQIKPSLYLSAIMAIIVVVFQNIITNYTNETVKLLGSVVIGVSAFFGLGLVSYNKLIYELKSIFFKGKDLNLT